MPRSCHILAFLALFSLTPLLTSAQHGFEINKIDIPLSDNGTATIVAGRSFLSFVHETTASGFIYAEHTGSFELMAGDSVADVICINQDIFVFSCTYFFPSTLPPGKYHFRVNITDDNNNSVLSDPFQVTSLGSFDCLTPPLRTYNITSTGNPNYRSLVMFQPRGGDVEYLSDNIGVFWDYVDIRNHQNTNITNLQFELVSEKTGQAFGNHPATPDDYFTRAFGFSFTGTGASVGAWRVRANYSNPFENGGQTVSALSDLFYIQANVYTTPCVGLGRSGSTGHSGSVRRFGSRVAVDILLFLSFFMLLVWVS